MGVGGTLSFSLVIPRVKMGNVSKPYLRIKCPEIHCCLLQDVLNSQATPHKKNLFILLHTEGYSVTPIPIYKIAP